jgi:hypothetical protein
LSDCRATSSTTATSSTSSASATSTEGSNNVEGDLITSDAYEAIAMTLSVFFLILNLVW